MLRGDRVVLRPVEQGDLAPFAEMLVEPSVARWWGTFDEARVQAELVDRQDDVEVFAVLLDGDVVGLIQYYEEDDPEYRHAGIDISLATRAQGHGVGEDAVRTLARHLITDRGHHRLVIDPAVDNLNAIACYEKVGFQPVGILRRYWRAPNGTWQDGLLLDLLAEDLAR
jgi:aminoglycoside 6'-N-acetyltransferase